MSCQELFPIHLSYTDLPWRGTPSHPLWLLFQIPSSLDDSGTLRSQNGRLPLTGRGRAVTQRVAGQNLRTKLFGWVPYRLGAVHPNFETCHPRIRFELVPWPPVTISLPHCNSLPIIVANLSPNCNAIMLASGKTDCNKVVEIVGVKGNSFCNGDESDSIRKPTAIQRQKGGAWNYCGLMGRFANRIYIRVLRPPHPMHTSTALHTTKCRVGSAHAPPLIDRPATLRPLALEEHTTQLRSRPLIGGGWWTGPNYSRHQCVLLAMIYYPRLFAALWMDASWKRFIVWRRHGRLLGLWNWGRPDLCGSFRLEYSGPPLHTMLTTIPQETFGVGTVAGYRRLP